MPKQKALPQRIIALPNRDKGWHESPQKLHKDRADFPHPFRVALVGAPNCGKSTLCQNLILHQSKPFERILIWHCDSETQEYADVSDEVVSVCPHMEDFDPSVKNLCIIDDVALKSLDKAEKMRLDRLCGNWSTHRSISVCLTSQQPNQLPASIRRMMNVFVLWRSTDAQSLHDVASKCGIERSDLKGLLNLLEGARDSLCIDLTGSPYMYRRNLFDDIIAC